MWQLWQADYNGGGCGNRNLLAKSLITAPGITEMNEVCVFFFRECVLKLIHVNNE